MYVLNLVHTSLTGNGHGVQGLGFTPVRRHCTKSQLVANFIVACALVCSRYRFEGVEVWISGLWFSTTRDSGFSASMDLDLGVSQSS